MTSFHRKSLVFVFAVLCIGLLDVASPRAVGTGCGVGAGRAGSSRSAAVLPPTTSTGEADAEPARPRVKTRAARANGVLRTTRMVPSARSRSLS